MQLRVLTAILIFLGSYLPLSVILLLQDVDYARLKDVPFESLWGWVQACLPVFKNPPIAVSFFLLTLLCLVVTLYTLRSAPGVSQLQVIEAKHIPADLINYVIPYVVSFMNVEFGEPSKYTGFFVFIAWMFWITYASGRIIFNPVLVAFGWKLYEVKYRFGGSVNPYIGFVLANTSLSPQDWHDYQQIQDVMIIKRRKGGGHD